MRVLALLHLAAILLAGCGRGRGAPEVADAGAPRPPPPEPRLEGATIGPFVPRGCFAQAPPSADGTTYFVRPDGGDAAQCTGRADAPYPGAGAGLACAWSHPFFALPPGGRPRIAGGDRLVVAAGSYRMGKDAPGAAGCAGVDGWDCVAPALPSGPTPQRPTRIVGLLSATGALPELWGSERPWFLLDLRDSDNVVVECLELTDHSSCIEEHGGSLKCRREEAPYGDWATAGIYAKDSENVTLRSLDIHGLASHGIHAGRLRDWTLEDVRLATNGMAGWDGDLGDEPSANAGTMAFRRVTISWNGCGEDDGRPTGCWGQSAGGYGDGLGTARTGGRWVFEDLRVEHNTSDGIDLLYLDGTGAAIFDRVIARGNAGNQLKARGEVSIANAVVDGNCRFFRGQPFTHGVDDCRAEGNAIAIEPIPGHHVRIVHSTVRSDGTVGLEIVVPLVDRTDPMRFRETGTTACERLEPVFLRNDVWLGGLRSDGRQTSLFYRSCMDGEGRGATIDHQYGVVHGVSDYGFGEEGPCPPESHNLCADPLLDRATLRPRAGSPAIDSGAPADATRLDVLGAPRPRGRGPDRGAYES